MCHLSYIYSQVLLIISSVTNRQSQFILLAGLVQLHFLEKNVAGIRQRREPAVEFELVMGSHLIFQLILSVYLMLSNIKVVSGVVVDRLHKPATDEIFR